MGGLRDGYGWGLGVDRETTDDNWPDWTFGAAYVSELARYVDISFTPSLVPASISSEWKSPEGAARAGQLYEQLRARRIGYAKEPWNPGRYQGGDTAVLQRIRGPQQTVQGPATCLDLALVFAGMALSVDIRPLICLRGGESPHALVVLHLAAPLSEQQAGRHRAAVPGFTERASAPDEEVAGVWDSGVVPGVASWALDPLAGSDSWLIVDVYRAAVGTSLGLPFAQASGRAAADSLRRDETLGFAPWWMVDVDVARGGLSPYAPPRGRAVPPIHSYLPAMPAFTLHASRQRLMDDLYAIVRRPESPAGAAEDRGSVVVLQGPSGYGKSMLAHHLATAADRGCGWFLNATDARVLTTSLAQAEREEQGWLDEEADTTEERILAAQALGRLRESVLPWVVVLDNCDVAPGADGLEDRMPRPGHAGQVVIVTTTNEQWGPYARARGWRYCTLLALDLGDLGGLGLSASAAAVDGRPLVAHALAALIGHGRGLDRPATGTPAPADGPGLVWDLVQEACAGSPGAMALARTVAWCPPEPLNTSALTGVPDAAALVGLLDRLRFVTRSGPGAGAVQMHRLFAAAVRDQTWRDAPAAAAEVISRLMTQEPARDLFIGAADTTALRRLEGGKDGQGEVARAAELLPDGLSGGLLWHGLGHIRERRGPVRDSAPHFRRALTELNPEKCPYQVAEATIGLARVTYQDPGSTTEALTQARASIGPARVLLAPLGPAAARQLSEQGNALYWLIGRTLAGRAPDPAQRADMLAEVRDQLGLSLEQRLRIARGLMDGEPLGDPVPTEADGLGPERAYFNLAGTSLLLAQTYRELAAMRTPESAESLRAQAREALDETEAVYAVVRALREIRYRGRAHPHLAACVNGLGLVAYYRTTLLGDARLPEAIGHVAAAFEQRREVADDAIGGSAVGVLGDPDVRKSAGLLLKVAIAACRLGYDDTAEGNVAVLKVFDEAASDLVGWPGMPAAHDEAAGPPLP